jgi:anti-sigma B factor antagonist
MPNIATSALVPLHEPDGAIDITNSVELRERMLAEVESGARAIVFDLHAVRYIDSSGLSALVSVATALERNRGELVLCNVDAAVMKVLEMTRLTEYFVLESSRDAAMERAAKLG